MVESQVSHPSAALLRTEPLRTALTSNHAHEWRVTVLAVVRHTRQSEELGREEMLGAGVVGRYASLAAAVLVALALYETVELKRTASVAI